MSQGYPPQSTWKWMIGIRISFLLGWPFSQVQTVSFRECKNSKVLRWGYIWKLYMISSKRVFSWGISISWLHVPCAKVCLRENPSYPAPELQIIIRGFPTSLGEFDNTNLPELLNSWRSPSAFRVLIWAFSVFSSWESTCVGLPLAMSTYLVPSSLTVLSFASSPRVHGCWATTSSPCWTDATCFCQHGKSSNHLGSLALLLQPGTCWGRCFENDTDIICWLKFNATNEGRVHKPNKFWSLKTIQNRKPIWEIGCCESQMSELKQWLIELSNSLAD